MYLGTCNIVTYPPNIILLYVEHFDSDVRRNNFVCVSLRRHKTAIQVVYTTLRPLYSFRMIYDGRRANMLHTFPIILPTECDNTRVRIIIIILCFLYGDMRTRSCPSARVYVCACVYRVILFLPTVRGSWLHRLQAATVRTRRYYYCFVFSTLLTSYNDNII